MKKRFLFCLGLAFIGWPQLLDAQTIVASGNTLSFDDPITVSPSTSVGGFCVYNDVITIGATSYDAIITIDNISNALISDFDVNNTVNSNSSSHFSPSVLWTSANGYITYSIDFIEDGSAAAPVPVTLGDIFLTAWDIDDVGPSGRYISSSGFSGYTLGSNTYLSYASTGLGVGTFQNATSGSNTSGTDGRSRVTLEYSSTNSISLTIGAIGTGPHTYLISGTNPQNWFPTTANESTIPTINTFGSTASFFTCEGFFSTGQEIIIEADKLAANLSISAPTGYQVSTSLNGTYSSLLPISPDSTGRVDTSIFIAMDGTAPSSNPADITLSSTGASDVLISVSGTTGGTLVASNFTKSDPTVCGGTDGSITFDVTNVPDGTYAISFEGGTNTASVVSGVATISGLSEEHYSNIILTDSNGCQTGGGNSISLLDPIDFVVTYSPISHDICEGSTATFGVSTNSNTSFQWYEFDGTVWNAISGETGNTFTTPNLVDTTKYKVKAISDSGCVWTSNTVQANVNPTPQATLTATPASCPGTADGSIDLTMVTTVTPITYLWSNGLTTEDISGVSSGTYSVTIIDPLGCQGSVNITVNDSDGVAPVVVAQDLTVQIDSIGNASITPADVDGGSSDNCSLTLSVDTSSWTCSDLGAHVVMLIGTDGNQNDTAYATVTIIDTIAPTISCGTDTTLYVAADTSGVNYSWVAPNIYDACGIDSSYTSDTSGNWFGIGQHTIWTVATDMNGNIDSCSFILDVQDTIAPSFLSCLLDTTMYTDALNCGVTLTWASPLASDNSDSVIYSYTDTSGTFFPVGVDTVFHYAEDPSGNSDTCFFVITVLDTIAPSWTGTLDTLTIYAGVDTCGVFTDSLSLTPPPIVESCGIDTLYHDANSYYALGDYDIYWFVTDVNGNTDSILQKLIVTENIVPEIYCPDSLIIYADADSSWTQVTWTGDSVYDNCGLDSAYFSLDKGGYLQIGLFKIDYFAYDLQGNGDTCSFYITVEDTVAPIINLAQGDTTLSADPDSCFASFAWTPPSITENSTNYSTTYYNSSTPSGNFGIGQHSIAYVVRDASGNQDSAAFTITVIDDNGPSLYPNTVALTLDAAGFDTLNVAIVDSASSDCSGIDSLWLSQSVFTCADVGSPTVWFYGLDSLGNIDSVQVPITVSQPTGGVVQATITSTDALCYGDANGTATINATGGSGAYSYTWINLGTTATATNLAAGTYFWEVSDTNGCTAMGSVAIAEPTPLVTSITPSNYNGYGVSSEGANDGSADLTVSGGTAPYTYTWNNGATTEDLSGLPEGMFIVTVLDSNGCSTMDTVVLTEPDYFSISATVLSHNICPSDMDGAAYATYSGGVAPISLFWSSGQITDTISGLTSGWYTVTAIDTNGALATDSVLILALDEDCDGIPNDDEGGVPGAGGGMADADGDGIPNQQDTDSDNDGISDAMEFDSNGDGIGFDDCDGDGVPNFLDADVCELEAATVLTPDNDGNNDFWVIPGIQQFPGTHVVIFNRLGLKVYENTDYQNDFDGRANTNTYLNNAEEILPSGTYFYFVRMGGTSTQEFNGYLYINR
jgi:gliding motility-associated-like protein